MKTEYVALKKQVYTNGHFKIVPIRYEDRISIMQWRNEQIYHLRQSKLLTLEDQDSYFDNVVSKLFEQAQPSQLLFSFLKDEVCIGYGGLVHINWVDRNAEISFIMDTSLEQTSFSELWSAYLALIEEVGFDHLDMHKIFTYAFDIRPHLYTALVNNGYEKEASLKQHCFFNGGFKDVVIHSKIANSPFLRKANKGDLELTFKWVNDKDIRKYSFNQNMIKLDDHKKWFYNKIKNENCLYYILCIGTQKMGSIRVDIENLNEGTISYLIYTEFQGKGYGKHLLIKIEEILKNLYPKLKKIKGKVLHENLASINIFRKLGYTEFENEDNFLFEKEI